MTVLTWIFAFLLIGVLLLVAIVALTFRWFERVTIGDAYFALPLPERRVLREVVARRFGRLAPLLRATALFRSSHRPISMEFRGVTAPAATCTPARFAAATSFVPDERDVFVATQMKCGTTWMQQVVYEVLSHGRGDLSDEGHRHMYALSPWIESRHSVSMQDAPRVGERQMRIIKTHLPADLCPHDPRAKYVYVTRHPVACFASTLDFLSTLMGPFSPGYEDMLAWYCSDEMFWRAWPEHVDGWWRWSQKYSNVLFVHYEEMLEDLAATVDRVAAFLDVSLRDDERAEVVRRSGFEYMKVNEEVFEMTPPTPFSASAVYLKSGSMARSKDVPDRDAARILAFCRDRLAESPYPAATYYPDLESTPTS